LQGATTHNPQFKIEIVASLQVHVQMIRMKSQTDQHDTYLESIEDTIK